MAEKPTEDEAASSRRADKADQRADAADEHEAASSRRADRADKRADAADMRATGADVRATGADNRATAADIRSDVTVSQSHIAMMKSLEPLERKLDRSIKARNRIAAALLGLILLVAGAGYADFWQERRRDYRSCKNFQGGRAVLREVIIRATPPREPPDEERDRRVAEFRRSLLDATPPVVCKRPPLVPVPWKH